MASYIKSATNQGVTTKVDIKALFCFEHVTDDSLKYLQDMINELQLESRSDRYQEVHFYFYPETEKDIDHIKDSFSKMFAGKDTFKYYLMDNRRLSRIYYIDYFQNVAYAVYSNLIEKQKDELVKQTIKPEK